MASITIEPTPQVPLLEWNPQQYPEADSRRLIVRNPREVASLILGVAAKDVPESIDSAANMDQLFQQIQELVFELIKDQVRGAHTVLARIVEQQEATRRLHEMAIAEMQQHVQLMYQELSRLAERDELQEEQMDWEPTPVALWDLSGLLEEEAAKSQWTQAEYREAASVPPIPPQSSQTSHIPLRIISRVPSSTTPLSDPDWLTKPKAKKGVAKRGRRPVIHQTPIPSAPPTPRQYMIRGAAARSSGGQGLGISGGMGEEGDRVGGMESPVRRIETPEPSGAGGAGGSGGGRGGASGGPPPPGDSDDDDDGDSDPEPNLQRHPVRWKKWHRRQIVKELGANPRPQLEAEQQPRSIKVPEPKPFKGKERDLNRFLSSLDSYFRLNPRSYPDDLTKILLAGLLMEEAAYDWFATYKINIDRKESIRVRGFWVNDPSFATWERFEASLRASFGGRVNRDKAVQEWQKLRQTAGIDAFLDEVTRLMWITGYVGDMVKDKLKEGLSEELSKDWAKVQPKPNDVSAQMAMLRDMGHVLEDWERHHKKSTSQGGKSNGKEKGQGSKPNPASKPADKASSSKDKPKKDSTWKDKSVELKGIGKDVLDQRAKDKLCLKCGKKNHSWFECFTKEPVTQKVASSKKRKAEDSDEKSEKKAKVASTQPQAPTAASGRILEIPEEDGSDLDIWAL